MREKKGSGPRPILSRQFLLGASILSLTSLMLPPNVMAADEPIETETPARTAPAPAKTEKTSKSVKLKKEKTAKSAMDSSERQAKSETSESDISAKSDKGSVETQANSAISESERLSKPKRGDAVPARLKSGLDAKTFKFVNQGNWKAAAARLEMLTAGSDLPTRSHAWLAFAYMFLNQTDSLNKLYERVTVKTPPDDLVGYVRVIQAFKQVLAGKTDDAAKTLTDLPKRHVNDSFITFALAAVAGKQGKASAAAELCQRAVALDPSFAWGYRTLGYLQSRWLNQPQEAEQSFLEALRLEPEQGEVREMLINERLARNDFDGAIDLANAGIKANTRDGKAHYRLAQILVQQWRLREALVELEQAIKVDPSTATYYRTRATIRRYQGNYDDAIADQKKAVELSNDKAFELVELATMYSQLNDSANAISNLNAALKVDPGNKSASKNLIALLAKEKRYDELVDAYKAAIKSQPKDAALHFSLAETLHALGEDDDAIEQYKEAANLDQKDARPHRRIGAIYSARRDFEKAEEAHRRALNINPGSVQDLVALGFCYAQRENYLQAEAGFVTALALQQLMGNASPDDPKREDIIRSLASLLIVEGRYQDARNQFESLYAMTKESDKGIGDKYLVQQARLLADRSTTSANELIAGFKTLPEKTQTNFRYQLIQTLLKAGKGELALEQLNDVPKEQSEGDPRWLSLKARALRFQGKFDDAKTVIEQAIAEGTKLGEGKEVLVAEALLEKARILADAGALKEAEDAANQAISKYDKVYAAYLVLGQIKLKQNDPADALDYAKKALDANPYFTDAYILTGDALLKQNKGKEAIENYKKATEIYPGLIAAHEALLRGYKALSLSADAARVQTQIDNLAAKSK